MGVIVFSVLLALGANEWRQAVSLNATVATVRETIRAETMANRAQVESALEHHTSMVAQLRDGGIILARIDMAGEGIDTTSALALGRSLSAAARARGAPEGPEFRAERTSEGSWRVRRGEADLRLDVVGDSAFLRGVGNISLRPAFILDSAWETAQITQAAVHMDPDVIAAFARARQLARLVDGTVSRLVDILYDAQGRGDFLAALQDLAMFETNLLSAYDDLLARL